MSASLPEKADVLVVGAGPAGSTLARDLAASGVDVVIIDKARFPRGKTCGGGVNVRVQKLLPFDLTPVVEQVITGISFTCNFESPFVRRSPEPLILTVRRETFDSFLLDRAREAGARFFERSACLALRAQGDSVEVETSAGICRARYVAGADGALGFTARRMNGGKEEGCLLAVHSEAPDSMLPDWDPTLIHIDWGSVKRSYAYLFPKKHFLSMGAGGFGVPSVQIKKYHRAYMATRWQKEATLPFSAAGFFVPLRKKRAPIFEGRRLQIGDAAGLIDPFTGEGIYSAVRSARIAGRVLQEALKGGWDSLKPYQDAIDAELMPELEYSRVLRGFFNLRPGYFHRKIASKDRWWSAMVRIIRGEKTFLDVKKKMGPVGSLLLRMAR